MKEQVLPEPVWAIPRASRPLSTAGMAVAWMGVGWVNSLLRIRVISASSKPKWAKLDTGLGGLGPDTLTNLNVTMLIDLAWLFLYDKISLS